MKLPFKTVIKGICIMGSFITEMTAVISYAGNSTFKPTVFKL